LATTVGGEGGVTVIGDAVNVAARLEKSAAAGEILVGPLTARLAGARAELRQRQPVVLKGRREPVEVWEAVGLQPGAGPRAAAPPLLIAIDDLHRSAEKMQELLGSLAVSMGRSRIMLVLAGRPDPGAWLTHFPTATTLRVDPLGVADARRLADALAGRCPDE